MPLTNLGTDLGTLLGEHEVRVVHRNQRWEVSVDGVTRPLDDWTYSRERAVARALERAREVGAQAIAVEEFDGTVDEWVALDGKRVSRWSLVG